MNAGRVASLRAGTAAMIFQDPRAAINPLRRIGDFLTEGVVLPKVMSRPDATARATELLHAVGVDDSILDTYPGQVSGGMLQRVMIAGALMGDPSLLLADEPTTALDVTTQAEVVALLARLQRRFGTGLLFVTHDLDLAAALGDRVYVMYAGRIVESGPAHELFAHPRHPYTAALLASTPRLDAPMRPARRHRRPAARSAYAPDRLPLRPALPTGHGSLRPAGAGSPIDPGPTRTPGRLPSQRPPRRDRDLTRDRRPRRPRRPRRESR